jgi:hypothetical protein
VWPGGQRAQKHQNQNHNQNGAKHLRTPQKKADVAEHPKVFHHIGLLVNEPPGTAGLPFI